VDRLVCRDEVSNLYQIWHIRIWVVCAGLSVALAFSCSTGAQEQLPQGEQQRASVLSTTLCTALETSNEVDVWELMSREMRQALSREELHAYLEGGLPFQSSFTCGSALSVSQGLVDVPGVGAPRAALFVRVALDSGNVVGRPHEAVLRETLIYSSHRP